MRYIPHWNRTRLLLLVLIGIIAAVMIIRLVGYLPVSERLPIEVFVLALLALLVLLLLFGGYRLNWAWTGFGSQRYARIENHEFYRGKTLWDWLQLLIVPSVLASVAFLFNTWNANIQRDIADDNQREAALQTYFDKMSELVVSKSRDDSTNNAGIHVVARMRTLTLLRRLDPQRQRTLLQFLRDSQIFSTTETIISLNGADLRNVSLRQADLRGVDLKDADLSFADLSGANLSAADLSGSSLKGAKLSRADLTSVNLRGADLGDADLSLADLTSADISLADVSNANLHGANLSDADLGNANLGGANLDDATLNLTDLSGANLLNATVRNANLWKANLSGAILWSTDLSGSNLSEANLNGADLRGANLTGAKIDSQQLTDIKSLQNTTMPDRTRHD